VCGIAGEVRFGGVADAAAVGGMVAAILHRGPDHQAVQGFGEAALGHARLSVIDLDPRSHQPMVDPATGQAIVFNGEIYNFQELRSFLEKDGMAFRTAGDTEVLLALYRSRGPRCLELLRGMFALAIWDPARHELFLARDRLGKKPLVYAQTPTGFVFASEIRALASHPAVSGEIDPVALDLYLSLQYVPAPRTIYTAIRKLPPAHWAVLEGSGLRLQRYWTLDFRAKQPIAEPEALEALEAELTQAVRLRMISDVPLGVLLSGGVDSSLVAAVMAKLADRPVRTFSLGFSEAAYNELPYASAVAAHLGSQHEEEVVRPDVADMLPFVVNQYGEPFADNSAPPTFWVSRMARRGVTVALTGDGGDELLGGYTHYRRSRLAVLAGRAHLPRPAAQAARLERQLDGTGPWGKLQRHWLYRYVYPEMKPLFRPEYFQGQAKAALWRPGRPQELAASTARWRQELIDESFRHADDPYERMLWIDSNAYLPGDVLFKVDIASMAYGLEVRCPLLDHKLIELCARLPVAVKSRTGVSKHLLKALALRYLPREAILRRKQGFSTPVGAWLKGPLLPMLRESFAAAGDLFAEHFRTETIERLVREHAGGRANHGSKLWTLLCLALWWRGRKG
jgi:asparagine synthase (glutamine-hydrolysing)